jgi:hypothetical protein
MARYIVQKHHDDTAFKLAEVEDEQQAINHVSDAAYQAMIDGQSVTLAVHVYEAGQGRLYLRMQLDMQPPGPGASPSAPGEYRH